MIGKYETHPAADAFPMLPADELKDLAASIEAQGQIEPAWLCDEGRILDGRNRAAACELLGIELIVDDALVDDPIAFVIAKNLARRHLSVGERAVAADKLARLPPHRPNGSAPTGAVPPAAASSNVKDAIRAAQNDPPATPASRSQPSAAAALGVGRRTVQRVASLREGGRQDLYDAVGAGEMTANRALRQMRKDAAVERISAEPEPLPSGPFRVISADPAWHYEKRAADASSRGKAHDDYPTMTVDDIAAMPVAEMAHPEGCVLWLWTTNAHLLDGSAAKVCAAWGFVPKTMLTWVKNRMGMGDWLRGKTEHAILAVRGSPVVNLTNETTALEGLAFDADVREHSRKPEEFYALVESLCPGSKCELFARAPRDGWTVWGAESELFADDVERAKAAGAQVEMEGASA